MTQVLPILHPTPRFLEGQVIAITAADRGFGRVMAQGLADAGATLVLVGKMGEQLAGLASLIERSGATAIPMQADVSVPLDWIKVQKRIVEIFGALQGVVHSADKRTHPSLTLLSENEWMDLFQANMKSSVGIAQTLLQRLPGSWLTIVGPHLDEGGLQGNTLRGGLRGLVDSAHSEGLRINLLLPSRSPSGEDELNIGVVNAVTALASPALMHLTGMCIDVPLPVVQRSDLDQLSPEHRANFLPPEPPRSEP
ncbi:SDR family NAD(P)-dependent oxidoreductase [Deinococcus sp. Marseille-Q6407]|uniref:SDR family NAD(P)-dependent oxidoreductase n=1 Tax=Deinococcus sp. Marseille-Q6407 TaxID=2969223 RepID=UPI0021BF0134|nr:SDR family oxidoreductase [Deinococcus sp. Marseille-Q6407]